MKERINVSSVIGTLSLNYEYENEYSCDFEPMNFPQPSPFMLVLDREGVKFLRCFLLFSFPMQIMISLPVK